MIEQIRRPSVTEDVSRSKVTEPPMRIPGIQDGKGTIGTLKISVPGIGTPIVIPIKVLTIKIQAESLRVQSKLLAQGTFSRKVNTATATTPTQVIEKMALSTRITDTANPKDHIHHVRGCSCNRFKSIYFLSAAGVGISTPHSFAGNPLRPQINPELAALIFAT